MDDSEYSFYHNKCGRHTFRFQSTEPNVPPLVIFRCISSVVQDIEDANDVALPIGEWVINCDGTGAIFVDKPTKEEKILLGADKDESKLFTMFKGGIGNFFSSYLETKKDKGSLPYLVIGIQCISEIYHAQTLDDIKRYTADMVSIIESMEASRTSG